MNEHETLVERRHVPRNERIGGVDIEGDFEADRDGLPGISLTQDAAVL